MTPYFQQDGVLKCVIGGTIMVEVKCNVAYTASYGCWFCLHVGSVAVYFGRDIKGSGPRLEIMTPRRWFRWSKGHRDAAKRTDRNM